MRLETKKIDEHAEYVFKALLGCETIPEEIIESYFQVKRMKDKVHPTPLLPETLAVICFVNKKIEELKALQKSQGQVEFKKNNNNSNGR